MKHYFLHVFILVLLPVAAVFAQPRYSVEKIPLCWTVGSTDSSITKVVLISSASDQLVTIGYYNADGNDITVSGGSLQFGYCGTGGGGGGGDDDWRWYGAVETYSKPLYRIGKTNIFVTTAADTTHGFRVDSTFQFRTDGGRDIFDWQVGGGTGTDYTPHAGLFYRGRNTFESSLVGSGHNNITLGADDNTISDRDRLGAIIFAGKNPAGSGGYRPGAMITAFADVPAGGWSGDSSATSLNFYVTRPNANTLTNTVTFQRDGRVELDRYQFFSDGVPERMLGFDDGSDDVTVHSIDGTPGNNSILGLNATGSGFEWKDQSDVANAGIRYTVYQPAHGFTLPAHGFIPVYRDSVTGWELALANDSTKLHSAYVVEVINSDSIVLMEAGILTVTGGHGLGFGDYFLTNAGSISMSPGTYNDWVATVWDTLTVALKATRPVAPGDTTTYVSGAGTVNVVPKWTSGSVLGNSSLSDDGVKVTTILPFQLPSWTTAGRPGAPLPGFIGWNTTNNNFDIRNSSTWVNYAQHSSGTGLGTSTRIPFYDANGRLNESTSLLWNYTSNYLQLGTTAGNAANQLNVTGSASILGNITLGYSAHSSSSTSRIRASRNGGSNPIIIACGADAYFKIKGTSTESIQSAPTNYLYYPAIAGIGTAGSAIEIEALSSAATALSGGLFISGINPNASTQGFGCIGLGIQNSAPNSAYVQSLYGVFGRGQYILSTANAADTDMGSSALYLYGVYGDTRNNSNFTNGAVYGYGGYFVGDGTSYASPTGAIMNESYGIFVRGYGATQSWAVFSDEGTNWFEDEVRIGGTASTPTANVDIDGSLRLRAISTPASVEDGEMWTSSTQKAITANQAGVNQTLVGTIFTGTSDATIANSVTETSITPTGVGTLTLPANFFVVGKTIEIEAWGVHTEDVVPTTLDLKLKLGSTVIASTGAQTMVTTASGQWKASFTLTCRTVGGSGTVFAQGDVRFNSSEIVGVTHAARNSAATTIDTTASQAVTITATHGAADTDNSITTNLLTIKVLN